MNRVVPVILCGGTGTRLWPLSREDHPKQFVDLGGGRTLFGDALDRGMAIRASLEPLVIGNEKYRFFVRDELRKRNLKCRLILEPVARNTAPAIALGALSALEDAGEEPLLLILPSDQYLSSHKDFSVAVNKALAAAITGRIVTFGIKPTYPAQGFGYISRGEKIDEATFSVREFVEKPAKANAGKMFASGNYFWNAGIFLMRPSVYLEELDRYSPDIYESCRHAWQNRECGANYENPENSAFSACPEQSIDYAVMEKTSRAAVCPLDMAWNDLGSWDAFFMDEPRDAHDNAFHGEVLLEDASHCQVYSNDRLVTAVGVDDLTIIETRDAVLVSRRGEGQRIKNLVGALKREDKYQYQHHTRVFRPWGNYETLARGDRFQVKRLIVNQGEALSLQLHHHRAEHWVIVRGTAEVTVGDTTRLYTENQSMYIPVGCPHRLKNPGKIPLVLIEIQSGSYLLEDDLVRLDDLYGRPVQESGE